MAQITKADLLKRIAELEAENQNLYQEVESLRQAQPKPQTSPVLRVAITPDNPLFGDLPRYQPHSKIACPTHGASQANKIGVCTLCACERARGGRLAA